MSASPFLFFSLCLSSLSLHHAREQPSSLVASFLLRSALRAPTGTQGVVGGRHASLRLATHWQRERRYQPRK